MLLQRYLGVFTLAFVAKRVLLVPVKIGKTKLNLPSARFPKTIRIIHHPVYTNSSFLEFGKAWVGTGSGK